MKSKLIQFYDKSAHSRWPHSLFTQDRVLKMGREISTVLSSRKKLKILDIGTGTGEFIFSFKKNFPKHTYYGCDISKKAIETNIVKKKGIKWSVQNIDDKNSYESHFFDLVIAGEIIEHVYDTDHFLSEINRITKKNGILIISTPNLASWIDRLMLLFGIQPLSTEVSNVSRRFGREGFYKLTKSSEESNSAGHLRCFTRQALKSMLEYYGFEVGKDISCHYHSNILNRIVTRLFPNLSESTLLLCTKKT